MDNLWNFMFFTGYFKKVNERMDTEDKYGISFYRKDCIIKLG